MTFQRPMGVLPLPRRKFAEAYESAFKREQMRQGLDIVGEECERGRAYALEMSRASMLINRLEASRRLWVGVALIAIAIIVGLLILN